MSNPALFKLTKPTGGLRRAWFQIITTFLLCFLEDDRTQGKASYSRSVVRAGR